MTTIKLIYNHITGTSRVFINEKTILKQTSLDHYLQVPFHYWYCSILHALYNEVMDSYTLEFVARPIECRLLESQKKNCPQCVRLTFSKLPINLPTEERLRQLAQLNPNLRPIERPVTVYTDEENGELMEVQLNAVGQFPLCSVPCKLRNIRELDVDEPYLNHDNETRFVYLYHTQCTSPFLQYLGKMGGRSFVFTTEGAEMPTTTESNVYCASFRPGKAVASYRGWLDYEILPSALRELLSNTTRSPETMDGLCMCALDQVDARRFVIPQQWIGVGERGRFETRGVPEQYPDHLEYESSNPGVIRVENGQLMGVQAGECYIDIYEPGFSRPVYHLNVRCVEVVREISFSQNEIELICGDQIQIPIQVTPANAENRDKIIFGSSDDSVVSVNSQTGEVVAHSSGEATVYASLGEMRTTVLVQVRSKLQAIDILLDKKVIMENEATSFTLKPYPSDANLGECKVTAEGSGLVQIRESEGSVVGISKGKVRLVASAENGAEGEAELTIKKPLNPNVFIGIGALCAAIIVLIMVFRLLFG